MVDFDEYYEATEPGRRERAFGWATAIGLQQVDGLTPSRYLIKTAKRNIEGEITGDEARRLVDEYYETRLGHEEPTGHQEADKVAARMNQIIHFLIFGEEIELHSRFLKLGQEYGSPVAEAIADLHRHNSVDEGSDVGINVGINVGIKFSSTEESAVKVILRNPRITASEMARILSVTQRQAERVIAALKMNAGLKRRGARKNGEWYFESTREA